LEKASSEQQLKFHTWVDAIAEKEVTKVMTQINPMLQLRRDVTAYVEALEKSDRVKKTSDNNLDSSRLSVVRRLLQYLNEQVEVTEIVSQKIKEYVTAIRELSPQPFEEDYLTRLAPSSLVDNTWRWIARVGYFFSSLSLPAEAENVSESPKPK
jgi:hypothetical protein